MKKNKVQIPLCRSTFLQNVTIAFGCRSLKSLRKDNPTLIFEVSEEDVDGSAFERLDIEARTILGQLKITLWEDRICWVYCRAKVTKNRNHPLLEFHARLTALNAEEVAELLRMTLKDAPATKAAWEEFINPNQELKSK